MRCVRSARADGFLSPGGNGAFEWLARKDDLYGISGLKLPWLCGSVASVGRIQKQ